MSETLDNSQSVGKKTEKKEYERLGRIAIRVTDTDSKKIRSLAKRFAEGNMSAFLRAAAFSYKKGTIDPKEYK